MIDVDPSLMTFNVIGDSIINHLVAVSKETSALDLFWFLGWCSSALGLDKYPHKSQDLFLDLLGVNGICGASYCLGSVVLGLGS